MQCISDLCSMSMDIDFIWANSKLTPVITFYMALESDMYTPHGPMIKPKEPELEWIDKPVPLLTLERPTEVKVTWEQLCAEHDLWDTRGYCYIQPQRDYFSFFMQPGHEYAWANMLAYQPSYPSFASSSFTVHDNTYHRFNMYVDEEEDKG